jgi:hypothetical protein
MRTLDRGGVRWKTERVQGYLQVCRPRRPADLAGRAVTAAPRATEEGRADTPGSPDGTVGRVASAVVVRSSPLR